VCKVAYPVQSGNFRLTWIRYGYDPRAHPSSVMYQTFECRFTPLQTKRIVATFGRPVGSQYNVRGWQDGGKGRLSNGVGAMRGHQGCP
jgi:hypothetical protein